MLLCSAERHQLSKILQHRYNGFYLQSNSRAKICREILSHLQNADGWQWKPEVSESKLRTCIECFQLLDPTVSPILVVIKAMCQGILCIVCDSALTWVSFRMGPKMKLCNNAYWFGREPVQFSWRRQNSGNDVDTFRLDASIRRKIDSKSWFFWL